MDDLQSYLWFLVAFCSTGLVMTLFIGGIAYQRVYTKIVVPLAVAIVLLAGIITFVPSTRQLSAIIVLPAIANSKLASETLGLGSDIISLARAEVQKLIHSDAEPAPSEDQLKGRRVND
jgi:hypothetical protein